MYIQLSATVFDVVHLYPMWKAIQMFRHFCFGQRKMTTQSWSIWMCGFWETVTENTPSIWHNFNVLVQLGLAKQIIQLIWCIFKKLVWTMNISARRVLKSVTNGAQKRHLNFESIERAVGINAANHFIKSMEQNTKIIVRTAFKAAKFKLSPKLHFSGHSSDLCDWSWKHMPLGMVDRTRLVRSVTSITQEWSLTNCVNLSTPKYTVEQLKAFSKDVVDPFQLVEKDISTLSGGIKELLGSDHPVLESCAKYEHNTTFQLQRHPNSLQPLVFRPSADTSSSRTAARRSDPPWCSPCRTRSTGRTWRTLWTTTSTSRWWKTERAN